MMTEDDIQRLSLYLSTRCDYIREGHKPTWEDLDDATQDRLVEAYRISGWISDPFNTTRIENVN